MTATIRKFFGITTTPEITDSRKFISDRAAERTIAWLESEGKREFTTMRDAERAAWTLRNMV